MGFLGKKNKDADLVQEIVAWNDADEHQKVVDAFESLPESERSFDLIGLYARALNNLERYTEALDALESVKETGESDAKWHYRLAYALFYLDLEDKAKSHLIRSLEISGPDEITQELLDEVQSFLNRRDRWWENSRKPIFL